MLTEKEGQEFSETLDNQINEHINKVAVLCEDNDIDMHILLTKNGFSQTNIIGDVSSLKKELSNGYVMRDDEI